MSKLTTKQLNGLAIAGIVACCLSIVCLVMMAASLFFFRKQHNNFRMRLAMCLCGSVSSYIVPALFTMSFFLADPYRDDINDTVPRGLCKWQGFMLQWFMVATDFWTGATALYVYLRVVHQKYLEDYQYYVYAFCWGVPLILAIVPLFGVGGGYVVVSSWCWIESQLLRLLFLYLPVWLNFGFMATLYVLVFRHTLHVSRKVAVSFDQGEKNREIEKEKKRAKLNYRIIKKLAAYAVVFVIVWIPGTINRIQNFVAPDSPNAGLYTAQAFTAFFAGVMYFIAYGVNNKTIVSWLWNKKMKKHTGSSNSQSNSTSNVGTTTATSQSRNESDIAMNSTKSDSVCNNIA